jgi:hypothetical protein
MTGSLNYWIDAYGIDAVLAALSKICSLKLQDCAGHDVRAASWWLSLETALNEIRDNEPLSP